MSPLMMLLVTAFACGSAFGAFVIAALKCPDELETTIGEEAAAIGRLLAGTVAVALAALLWLLAFRVPALPARRAGAHRAAS